VADGRVDPRAADSQTWTADGQKKEADSAVGGHFELLRTLWTTNADAKGWDPVQLSLIMLLASITGYRPDALLSLRHQDVKITLLPDPAFDN
jgi:hypothetical protein